MKQKIESRKPEGALDYIALCLSTCGVGYLPIAPGTFGSMVGVLIYLAFAILDANILIYLTGHGWTGSQVNALAHAVLPVLLLLFCLAGIWAAGRSTEFFGDKDPSHAVVDEVMGQLIAFLFIPFGLHWGYILGGFLLFRLFDIWKPYPIDDLQSLPAGIGICADDILAGVYAGICIAIAYAVQLAIW
jgi:phosphatidylglycerophosphatase A